MHGRVCDRNLSECIIIINAFTTADWKKCVLMWLHFYLKLKHVSGWGLLRSTTYTSLPCVWNQAICKKVLYC